MACKVTGTLAFLGVAGYALWIQYDQTMKESDSMRQMQKIHKRLAYSVTRGPRWLSVTAGIFIGMAGLRFLK